MLSPRIYMFADEGSGGAPDEGSMSSAPKGHQADTWTPEEGVGGELDEPHGLEEGEKGAVDDAAKKAAEELGDADKDKDTDKDKPPEGDKDKKGEDDKAGEPEKLSELEALKKDLAESKTATEALKGQMSKMQEEAQAKLDEAEAKRLAEEERLEKASSAEEKKIRDALMNTPDDDLSETELKTKNYLKALEKSVTKKIAQLDQKLEENSKAQLTKEYSQRFDNIMSTHNKDGEDWLDDNDKSLIASIAIDKDIDDIEAIATELVRSRKEIFEKLTAKKLEEIKKTAVKKYLALKIDDRKKFIEKSADAAPPESKRKDSLERPASLIAKVANRFREATGAK